MFKRIVFLFLILAVSMAPVQNVSAQSSGPIYIIQEGDTLYNVALRFNVSLDDLIAANPSIDPNVLAAGQQVVIPGLEGVTGVLQTEVVPFGDSLKSLSRRTRVSDSQLIKLKSAR